jgi:hypothetical protein
MKESHINVHTKLTFQYKEMNIKKQKKNIKYLEIGQIYNIFSIETFVFTNNNVEFLLQLLQNLRVPSKL